MVYVPQSVPADNLPEVYENVLVSVCTEVFFRYTEYDLTYTVFKGPSCLSGKREIYPVFHNAVSYLISSKTKIKLKKANSDTVKCAKKGRSAARRRAFARKPPCSCIRPDLFPAGDGNRQKTTVRYCFYTDISGKMFFRVRFFMRWGPPAVRHPRPPPFAGMESRYKGVRHI